MEQMATFTRDGPFPSYFANALAKVLSLSGAGVTLQLVDPTHIQLPAGANDSAAILAVQGQWRWVESTLGPIAHPGGAAGIYPVYAVASANNISSTPNPYTDDTSYAFGLQILAPGVTPTIVAGTVDIYRKIGNAHWSGSAITRLDQLVPAPTLHAGQHAVGGADPLTPADIAAVPAGDSAVHQPGDLIHSAAATRAGAVLCDGATYPRGGIYAALFAAIGTTYGVGDGSTTFNVPDFTGQTVVGGGAKNGASPVNTTRTTRTRAQFGGEETVKLTSLQSGVNPNGTAAPPDGLPFVLDNDAQVGVGWGASGSYVTIFQQNVSVHTVTAIAGGNAIFQKRDADDAHDNMQPWGVANIFIKL
jgi:microcystin-dependent protein